MREADLLLHVIDVTHKKAPEQAETVNETLKGFHVSDKPQLLVLNKLDLLTQEDGNINMDERLAQWGDDYPWVVISAAKGWHLDDLMSKIQASLSAQRT